jgi:hypothetical protein
MKKFMLVLVLTYSQVTLAESLSVHLFGLTGHGEKPGSEAAARMTRKLDDNGIFAQHPEFNMTYKTDTWNFTSIMLKDCFDNTAYYLGAGKTIWKDETQDVGFTFGIYYRESVPDVNVPTYLQKNGYDYLPFPFLTYSKRIPITEKLNFETSLASNLILNHWTFGFNFEF